jgi:hypothetical protein
MADTLRQYDIELLIHGAARGADSLAAAWAHDCHVPQLGVRADWNKHGRAAGPIRNQIMLDEGKPHLVIAFPGGTGTADMVRRARAAKVRVISVPQKGIEQS